MQKLSWLSILFMLLAPLATAEIFKCPGKNGKTVYQNFSCELDSIGSAATAIAPKDVADTAAATPFAPAQPQPQSSVAEVAAVSSAAAASEPRSGMTIDEVRATAWGAPTRTENSEVMEGLIEVWHWGDTRMVQFDHKGRVELVQP